MHIESVKTFHAHKWLFVRIETSSGLVGWGESGLWTYPRAAAGVIDHVKWYLEGKDPLLIEHHWQYLHRFSHVRGSAVGAALSAVELALWDISGKYFEVPVYRLLGGPVRDRVRLYVHIKGHSTDEVVESAVLAAKDGYTAVRFDPFKGAWPGLGHAATLAQAEQRVAAVRRAVGDDVDLCVECHFKLNAADAPVFARALEPHRVLFIEDPIPPESVRTLGAMASRFAVPIATGERLTSLSEFADLLASGPIGYLRPDVCLVGGLTQSRKVAAIAEAVNAGIVPHNPLSPLSTAACVQLGATIPNLTVLEYTDDFDATKLRIVPHPLEREGGYLHLPTDPGLGVEVDEMAIDSLPAFQGDFKRALRSDGSVADH